MKHSQLATLLIDACILGASFVVAFWAWKGWQAITVIYFGAP